MLWAFIAATLAASPDPDALRAACSDGQGEACRTLGGLYLVGVAVDAYDTTGARFMEMACDAGDMKPTSWSGVSIETIGRQPRQQSGAPRVSNLRQTSLWTRISFSPDVPLGWPVSLDVESAASG